MSTLQQHKPFQLRLLGAFEASWNGRRLVFRSDKIRALLAYLALEGNRPHNRNVLAAMFWGESSQKAARNNLRASLSRLRQSLTSVETSQFPGERPLLVTSRQTVQFNPPPGASWIDAVEFDRLMEQSEQHFHHNLLRCSTCIGWLTQAAALYRGDFLAGLDLPDGPAFDDWRLLQQERRHQQAMYALQILAEHHLALGNLEEARRYAWQRIKMEPWRKEDVLPSETSRFPPGLGKNEHNLPRTGTTFFGRTAELTHLTQKLFDPDYQLITITGLGGVGKTRLALAAAQRMQPHFPDGVWFVPLAGVSNETYNAEGENGRFPPRNLSDFLAAAAAERLELTFHQEDRLPEQLARYLHNRELLLILDNVEHLLAGAAKESEGFVLTLLQNAPQTTILLTSRQPLGFQEEYVMRLEGLPIPASGGEAAGLPDAVHYSSVQLFAERAKRARPDFQVTLDNLEAIVDICRLTEGLPLGLELAAVWVRQLNCAEIAQAIRRDLDFLTVSGRDVPMRHRNLRAVFEQSWKLLDAEEQAFFARLSVFRGGFRLEAAQQAASASAAMLAGLTDKGLLRRGDYGRYELHELLRQYAAEKLGESPEEETAACLAHCRYYADFTERRESLLYTERQSATLAELGAEIDNIRAGWQWATHHPGPALAEIGRYAAGIRRFYERRGWFAECLDMFEQMAAALEQSGLPPSASFRRAYGQTLAQLGLLHWYQESLDKAAALLEKSRDILPQTENGEEQNFVLRFLGTVAWQQGAYEQARQYLEESLAALGNGARPVFRAKSLAALGTVLFELGNFAEAGELFNEGLAVLRKHGDIRYLSHGLTYLTQTLHALGKTEEAALAFRELQQTVSEFERAQDDWAFAFFLGQVGETAVTLQQYETARQCFYRALATAVTRQMGSLLRLTLLRWGAFAARRGSCQTAERALLLRALLAISGQPDGKGQIRSQAARLAARLAATLPEKAAASARTEAQTLTPEASAAEILRRLDKQE